MGTDKRGQASAAAEAAAAGPPGKKAKGNAGGAPPAGAAAAPAVSDIEKEWRMELQLPPGMRKPVEEYAPLRTKHKVRWLTGAPAGGKSSIVGTWEVYGRAWACSPLYESEQEDCAHLFAGTITSCKGRLQLIRVPEGSDSSSFAPTVLPNWPEDLDDVSAARLVGRLKLQDTGEFDDVSEAHIALEGVEKRGNLSGLVSVNAKDNGRDCVLGCFEHIQCTAELMASPDVALPALAPLPAPPARCSAYSAKGMTLLDDPNRPPGGRELTLPQAPPLMVRTGDLRLSVMWKGDSHGEPGTAIACLCRRVSPAAAPAMGPARFPPCRWEHELTDIPA